MKKGDVKFFAGLTKVISEYMGDSDLCYFLISPIGDDICVTGNICDLDMDDLPVAEIAAKLRIAMNKPENKDIELSETIIEGELH